MTILSKLTELGREIAAASRSVQENIAELRRQIATKRRELESAQRLPVPRAELVERFRAMIDARAERFAHVPPPAMTWPCARDLFRPLSEWKRENGQVDIREVRDLFDFVCFFVGDTMKANASKLLTIDGWADGLPTSERAATIASLEREVAELETAEERAIDEAAAAGVQIAHRPDVAQRRATEAHQAKLHAATAAAQHDREAAINTRAATRAIGRSEYVTQFENRHRS